MSFVLATNLNQAQLAQNLLCRHYTCKFLAMNPNEP
jgi:hypothetical protein